MIQVEIISDSVTRYVITEGAELSAEIVTYKPTESIWDMMRLINWLESGSQNWIVNFAAGLKN